MAPPRTVAEGPDPAAGKGGHYEPSAHADEDWVRLPNLEYRVHSESIGSGQRSRWRKWTLHATRSGHLGLKGRSPNLHGDQGYILGVVEI